MNARGLVIWVLLGASIAVPILVAAGSPLLAWRQPVYIASGLAAVMALALLLVQPLAIDGHLPGLGGRLGARVHRGVGVALLAAVVVHVGGLWITSPPDVVDALLLVSPTPFSIWGVLAMWALFGAALLAAIRGRRWIRPSLWRLLHTVFAAAVALGTVVHALLIEGTMGPVSKIVLCALVILATAGVVVRRRAWAAYLPGSGLRAWNKTK